MRSRTLFFLLPGLSALLTAGCVTFTEPPARPGAAPATVQRILADDAYALNAQGEPGDSGAAASSAGSVEPFAWEKALRDNPAARSLIFGSFYGPAAGIDFSDYYNDYVLF